LKWFKRKPKSRFDETTQVCASSRVSKDSTLGRYCYVGERCDITRATIGNYVSIANNVSIGPGEHGLTGISTSSLFYDRPYDQLTAGDCVIESDVWIGVDSIIRRGVTLGIGSVVGANSFVNDDVPDFGIVVGSPARIIGFRFPESQRAIILKSRWWDYDLERAKQIMRDLVQVPVFNSE
jgi:virginiamycin A acetyltransferase